MFLSLPNVTEHGRVLSVQHNTTRYTSSISLSVVVSPVDNVARCLSPRQHVPRSPALVIRRSWLQVLPTQDVRDSPGTERKAPKPDVVDAQARWAREAPVGFHNRLLRAVACTCCFPQHSIPSKLVLGRYWYGFSSDTALRHVASRVSDEVAVRKLVCTRRFSVSTDASAETVHRLKLSQTDYNKNETSDHICLSRQFSRRNVPANCPLIQVQLFKSKYKRLTSSNQFECASLANRIH